MFPAEGLYPLCGPQQELKAPGSILHLCNFIYKMLHCLVSGCSEWGLVSSCGVQASHCGGFSCCRVFPGSSAGEESACNAGDLGSISRLGRSPGEGNGYPLQYSCLENPMDRESLTGYSAWGGKGSDTTERRTLLLSPVVEIKL